APHGGLSRAGSGGARHHRRRGPLRRHGPLRPRSHSPRLVHRRPPRAPAQLLRPGRPRAAGAGGRGHPLLSPRPSLPPLPSPRHRPLRVRSPAPLPPPPPACPPPLLPAPPHPAHPPPPGGAHLPPRREQRPHGRLPPPRAGLPLLDGAGRRLRHRGHRDHGHH